MESNSKHRNKPDKSGHLPENLKENPFRVPEGYFESFNERLQEKLAKDRPPKAKPLLRISRKVMAAAAAIIILLSAGSVLLVRYYNKPAPAELPYFTITLSDLEEAIGMERFDESALISFYLENTDVFTFSEESDLMDKLVSDTTITTWDIEEYLIESNELENLLLNL